MHINHIYKSILILSHSAFLKVSVAELFRGESGAAWPFAVEGNALLPLFAAWNHGCSLLGCGSLMPKDRTR